ncbi:BSD domain-containing protein [Toxoplasma gondii RUB]|uniref:BSD domain-containing protein n=1 Tax=Toxoplasma gondii RUB TaxID=935652 RepID=A0A086M290_TOXGO|nr:BSD domain-containing protein [Toxoplasma gondii RUB]
MGASESTDSLRADQEARELRELNGEHYQDAEYPWFFIVQWACEKLPADAVFTWNLSDIKAEVAELTADPMTFLACCPADEAFRESGEFSFTENGVFVEWAMLLVELLPSLADVRYRLVPAKVAEEEFWCRFFSAVRLRIQQHVLAAQEQPHTVSSPSNASSLGHRPAAPLPLAAEAAETVGRSSLNGFSAPVSAVSFEECKVQRRGSRSSQAETDSGLAHAGDLRNNRVGAPTSVQGAAAKAEDGLHAFAPHAATNPTKCLDSHSDGGALLAGSDREWNSAEDPRHPTLIGAPSGAAASGVRTPHYVMQNGGGARPTYL